MDFFLRFSKFEFFWSKTLFLSCKYLEFFLRFGGLQLVTPGGRSMLPIRLKLCMLIYCNPLHGRFSSFFEIRIFLVKNSVFELQILRIFLRFGGLQLVTPGGRSMRRIRLKLGMLIHCNLLHR